MTGAMKAAWRACRCQSGTTAIEFATICLPLLLLTLGIVEFGRALNTRNDLSFAADFAARKVLIGESSVSILETAVRAAFTGGEPELLQVSVGTETVDGIEFRTLAIRYPFTLLIPGLHDGRIGLSVSRRIPVQ
ncbi:TadE/TadG family type IV pilus assembly protein [Mesorhizobium sp.]|uniref:TadE/TadG family type IV pilus assembly protein n=1 Tax=Mesorhizobium sp. TaxID=1871066 RepID=UPI0012198C7B|nr:TadE/TadG family type IV pilus assembly protein [Mesorhizobium sp.]TIS55699.1 MAG: pilus assembly protein [Mesorhizobium sp.]TIS86798.1 MAG: pilus assembly protein [Mesorhizobium sp.]TJW47919.1 MAG: pilus assembly protein [Mesorhizobium sp.]